MIGWASSRMSRTDAPDFELTLSQAVDRARARWPGIRFSNAEYRRHVMGHLASGDGQSFRRLELEELFLTGAAGAGDRHALACLEREYLGPLAAVLQRPGRRSSTSDSDEVLQRLRHALLVPGPGSAPRIESFDGRGKLSGWLRVAAVRAAIRAQDRRPAASMDAAAELPAPGDDPELRYTRERYAREFKAAFSQAAKALSPRQRNLLRQQLVHGLTMEQLAAVHQVHRATIVRWLAEARNTLVKETRTALKQAVSPHAEDIQSVMRLALSQMDISLRRILKTSPGEGR